MKKVLSLFLLVTAFFNILSFSAFAESQVPSTVVIENADGSTTYEHSNGTITIVSAIETLEGAEIQTRGTTKNIAGSISAINTDKDSGAENWRYKLIGYFTYEEGVSCICTNATHEVTITNDWWWHFSEGGNSWSGNAAYGVGKFEYKVLFITTETVRLDMRICCDNYGNFY